MALSVGNYLRVNYFFTQGTNDALVTSFWRVNNISVPGTYTAFAHMMAHMLMVVGGHDDLIVTDAKLVKVVVDNLSTAGEYGEWTGEFNGAMTGDPCPPFVAIEVKQTLETRITRGGYKRIPFVGENTVSGNTLSISAPTRTSVEDFWKGALSYTFDGTADEDITVDLQAIVVGRTLNEETGTYELDLSRINYVTDATITHPTSQVSRKV